MYSCSPAHLCLPPTAAGTVALMKTCSLECSCGSQPPVWTYLQSLKSRAHPKLNFDVIVTIATAANFGPPASSSKTFAVTPLAFYPALTLLAVAVERFDFLEPGA